MQISLTHRRAMLFIAVFSTALYANTLQNGFVYDDRYTIEDNTLIKSLYNLPELVKGDYFVLSSETTYRPLVTFTYFIDYAIYGLRPWGFHVTNVLLNAINGVLLYILLIYLTKEPDAVSREPETKSLLITLLFVSHPVLTEAVNAVSFREDLLAFLFYMAAFILYIRLRSSSIPRNIVLKWYVLSCFLYLLALLSKEMAASFPLIVCCYEWIYRKYKVGIRSIFTPHLLGYLSVTLIYFYLRFNLYSYPVDTISWDITENILTVPTLLLSYIKLTLFPVSLSAAYELSPIKSIISPAFIISSLEIAAILGLTFKTAKKEKAVTFGVLFFLLTMIPVYNIIPTLHPLAERYLYIPSVGFLIVGGSVINTLVEAQTSKLHKVYVFISFALVIGTYSFGVVTRNGVWRDGSTFWADVVRKMPNNSDAHDDLGTYYLEQGRLPDAIREFKTAIHLRPDKPVYHFNLGNAFYKAGDLDEAMQAFLSALRLKPDYEEVHSNIGSIYVDRGLIDRAISEYKLALKLNPDDYIPHYNLGKIYHYKHGKLNEAISEYLLVIKLKPEFEDAHFHLGNAYLSQGRPYEAIEEYQAVLNLKPNHVSALNNLGLAYFNAGMISEAIEEYLNALRFDPNNVDAHYNLGLAYNLMNLKDKAKKEFEIVLKLKPDFNVEK